jgi:ABC-type dipeptide/oligopeptide/nickel transport system permease component
MAKHLLRRLGGIMLALLTASGVVFTILNFAPGDAAEVLVGDTGSQVQLDELRREMGLDLPLASRYLNLMIGFLTRGDLGRSLITNHSVSDLIAARLPNTLLLALASISLAAVAGIGIGMAAAMRAGGLVDTVVMGITSLGLAIPSFWSALLLIMLFSLQLRWLPVVGGGSVKHLVLPVITLAFPTTAVTARMMRSALLDQLMASYVWTARAKGLPPRQVLHRHVMRNSLIPVFTLLGLHLGHLLGGAFIVETIYGWPGLGRLTVQAIFDRDMPVVMGAALTVAAIYLLINLVVDLLTAWLDPRLGRGTTL